MRFHVKEAGADAKLIQHGPLGVTYHRRHPISTVPVARITAHATVPSLKHTDFNQAVKKQLTFIVFEKRHLCLVFAPPFLLTS